MKCDSCGNECDRIEEELDGIVGCLCGEPERTCRTCYNRAKDDPKLKHLIAYSLQCSCGRTLTDIERFDGDLVHFKRCLCGSLFTSFKSRCIG